MKRVIASILIISLLVLSIPNVSVADTNNRQLKSTTITCFLDEKQKFEIFTILYNDSELWISTDDIANIFRLRKTVAGYYDKEDKVYYKFSTLSPVIVVERWIGSLEYNNTQNPNFSKMEIDNKEWVPFTDSINLLERDFYYKDGFLHITEQHETFLNLASRESISLYQNSFQLYDLYGDNTNTRILAGSFANFWTDVLSTFGLSFFMGGKYENIKCTQAFVDLLVASSSDELNESIDEIEVVNDILLDEDGELSNVLQTVIDKADGDFYTALEELKSTVNDSSGDYRRNRLKLLKTIQNAVKDEGIANQIKEIQKSVSGITSALDVMINIIGLLHYMEEFKNRDVFAIDAVDTFLSNVDDSARICQVSGAKETIQSENKRMKTNTSITYGVRKWLDDFLNDEAEGILNGSLIELFESVDGGLILIGWNLAKNVIPFLENAFDDIDHDGLIAIGSFMQESTLELVRSLEVSKKDGKIDENGLFILAQTYYLYLKSCYICREVALQIMRNNNIDETDSFFSQTADLNSKIVPMISFLSGATSDLSDVSFYGRLPENISADETKDIIDILHINSDDYKEVRKEHLAYKKIIDEYTNAISSKEYTDLYLNTYAISQYKTRENTRIGYVFYDIDHNGRDELLIGLERDGHIDFCDLYSFDINNNWAERLLYVEMNFTDLLKPSTPEEETYPTIQLKEDGGFMVMWGGDSSLYQFNKDGYSLEVGSWNNNESETILENSFDWVWFADYSVANEFAEDDLKEILCANLDGSLIGWYYDDFYGDGVKEGFGIFKGYDVEIWMILQDGTYEQVLSGSFGTEATIINAGRQKYLVWEQDGGGSSSTSFLFGVDRQHNIREPFVSGNYMSFCQDNEQYNAYLSYFEGGGHKYDLIYFDYDEDKQEFEPRLEAEAYYRDRYLTFLKNREYELQLEIPEECYYLSDIDFQFYTIVDIDTNGTPELIIREGKDNEHGGGDGVSMVFQCQGNEINKLCCKGKDVESPLDVGLFHVSYYGPGFEKDLKTLSWTSGEGHGTSFYQLNGDYFVHYMEIDLLMDKSGYSQIFPQTGIEKVITGEEAHDFSTEVLEWSRIP